jgi:mRNA interferase MazF
MTTTRAGEVWLAEVEFTDGRGSKPRPMLVLFSDPRDSILAVVTSAAPRTPRDLFLSDWRTAGLRAPSTVRLDKLVTMSHQRLWGRLGQVTPADWAGIVRVWNEHFRLS